MSTLTLDQSFAINFVRGCAALPGSNKVFCATEGGVALVVVDYVAMTQTPSVATTRSWHVLYDGTRFWVADQIPTVDQLVYLYDTSAALLATVDTTVAGPSELVSDGTFVYAQNVDGNFVSKMQAPGVLITNEPNQGSPPVQTSTPLVSTAGTIWFVNAAASVFSLVNLASGIIANLAGVTSPSNGFAFDGTHFWYSDVTNNLVKKLSLAGAVVASFPFTSPGPLAFDGTNMWVASAGLISVCDLTGAVLASLAIAGPFFNFTFLNGFTFVTSQSFFGRLYQLTFTSSPPLTSGRVHGTHVGFMQAGQFSGGTK